ncbi:MAG: AmpG family muropeptide MFS transporter [Rhodospirillaceae bacterium]|jgi:MFS transporter, PAT family, beta-lactamase induction signal transducer AmpG|nr:AmpG family muropeptide MFS transporter [Rhodospirillaceae bacterium]
MNALLQSLAVYVRRPILVVLILGFSSGLPLALSFSTLSVWMREAGVDLASIGVFSLVGTPYVLKFLWAPLMDRAPLPPLTNWLGRRRGWMIATQLALMAALAALGASDPIMAPWTTATLAVLVSFCSASQDIVVDAYRIESLGEDEQGAGAATLVLGYRVGMLASGAGALLLADMLGWFEVYLIMAGLVVIGIAAVLASPEPDAGEVIALPSDAPIRQRLTAWGESAVVAPFSEFMSRDGWLAVLLFILLYKFGDAFAGTMANPFYIDTGFSKTEIAQVTKVFGLASLLIGLFIGGVLVKRMGLLGALLVCGVLQAVSNLMFAVQAEVGYDINVLTATIAIENVTGGMGTAAFVAYLSSLTNVAFTATQYALLSSFMGFGRTVLSASSGWFAENLGWVEFFIASTFVALPGLILLIWLKRLYPDHAHRRGGADP